MVDDSDRRGVHHAAMDHLPRRDGDPPCVALGHVGTGHELALRPAGVVLGHCDPQVCLVADGADRALADALGEAVEEGGASRLAESSHACLARTDDPSGRGAGIIGLPLWNLLGGPTMPENTTVIESLNREELYKQVWSQPMTKTAKSYGLSDVGLAKLCRKLNVPTPGRGYLRRWRTPPKPATSR